MRNPAMTMHGERTGRRSGRFMHCLTAIISLHFHEKTTP